MSGKSILKIFPLALSLLMSFEAKAEPAHEGTSPDWSTLARVPEGGRANILNLSAEDWQIYQRAGKIHAQVYPVSVTGILPPYRPLKNFIEGPSSNPLKEYLNRIVRNLSGFKSMNGLLRRLGLHDYPNKTDIGVYSVPYPREIRPDYLMGLGFLERGGAQGFTFSCAGCHSSELFGKTVLGMTNRFPRANDFFYKAKVLAKYYNPHLFQYWMGSTHAETKLMDDLAEKMKRIAVKEPIVLGLDTSLAQVGMSLNLRTPDENATPSRWTEKYPTPEAFLDKFPADSKPAVWWNVKYKNKWLSDGSVISGNPIFTNIIWNEVGRGVELPVLENWLADNQKIIDELAAAVFATEAPRITDFFPAEKIDIIRAKRGEQIFNQSCSRCHGVYEKGWSLADSEKLSLNEQLKTTKVIPLRNTPIEDVGTDPFRRWGMRSLEKLNKLSISKRNNVVIKVQDGYVPPPLVGIWARWPYMHNNSIPNLCALLTSGALRPKTYYAGEAKNQDRDFDFECNGYPLGDKTPKNWQDPVFLYETHRTGMSNLGHDQGIFIENGKELLTQEDKKNLIVFLQTL